MELASSAFSMIAQVATTVATGAASTVVKAFSLLSNLTRLIK